MGAGPSRDRAVLLEAARRGDSAAVAAALKQAGPAPLVRAATLLRRQSVLHVAARHGQAEGAHMAFGCGPGLTFSAQELLGFAGPSPCAQNEFSLGRRRAHEHLHAFAMFVAQGVACVVVRLQMKVELV
jgi:hypothetical protein